MATLLMSKECGTLPLLLVTALLFLLFNLNAWGVLEASEARYAEISREMFRSGDWWHPTLLNIYHYHKPPVTFWLTCLGLRLFGVNAFGARFFLQLSLIAQAALVYGINQRLFKSPARSWIAAAIYLSLPLTLISARNLTTDSFLTTFTLAVVYCMSAYYCQRRIWGIHGSAIFIALGFLTKGQAVFVVPFCFWLYLMLARKVNFRVPLKHFLGALALCVTVGLSWYWAVSQQVPGLASYFVGHQVVDRMVSAQAFRRDQPVWYYPLILLTTTLPWTLIYIASLLRAPIGRFGTKAASQLSLYWLLLPLVVFTASRSKLMLYLLPIYSGLAIVLSSLLFSLNRSELKLQKVILIGFYTLLGVLALAAPFVVSQLGIVQMSTSWPMTVSALLLLAMPLLIRLVDVDKREQLALISVGSMLVLNLYSGYFSGSNELLLGGTRPVAQFIKDQGLRDRPVLVYNTLLPSLAFNLDRDIVTINEGELDRETQFQTDEAWKQFWIFTDDLTAVDYMKTLIQGPSSLVLRGELPSRWRVLFGRYPYAETIGNWTILYRPSNESLTLP